MMPETDREEKADKATLRKPCRPIPTCERKDALMMPENDNRRKPEEVRDRRRLRMRAIVADWIRRREKGERQNGEVRLLLAVLGYLAA